MRPFRFPRAMIVVMVVTLVSVGFAIERARQIAIGGDTKPIWSVLPGIFGAMLCAMVNLGLIGYGILRTIRQS